MGKISNMQQKQNIGNGVNLSYVRKQAKPRFGIKGIKDVALLYKPGIENEYDFYPSEKKFIRALRLGTLSIAALASAATIATGASHIVNHISDAKTSQSVTSEQEMDMLTKDDVLASAEDALLNFLYQNSPSDLKDRAFIKYGHDPKSDMDTLAIYDRFQNPNSDPSVRFSHARYNNSIDKVLHSSSKNDPAIDEFLNSIIDLYNSQDLSQEELEELDGKISSFDFSNLKFDSRTKSIVSVTQDKELESDER